MTKNKNRAPRIRKGRGARDRHPTSHQSKGGYNGDIHETLTGDVGILSAPMGDALTQPNGAIIQVECKLWAAADELRANSNLRSSEYFVPVLGIIFLRYADHRFTEVERELASAASGGRQIGSHVPPQGGPLLAPARAAT